MSKNRYLSFIYFFCLIYNYIWYEDFINTKPFNILAVRIQLTKLFVYLLIMSGVEEDALVGTMLLLKDSVKEQEDMLLYLWDNKPTPEQIDKKLVEMVERQ